MWRKTSGEKNKARCSIVCESMLSTVGENAYIKPITYIHRESLWKVETKRTGCLLGGELISWGTGDRILSMELFRTF